MGQIIDFSSVKREREREGRGRGGEQFEKEFVKKAVNFQMSRAGADGLWSRQIFWRRRLWRKWKPHKNCDSTYRV